MKPNELDPLVGRKICLNFTIEMALKNLTRIVSKLNISHDDKFWAFAH